MSDRAIQRQSIVVIRYALSLHANSIMIIFPFFISDWQSSAVEGNARWTPSPRQLNIFLAAARRCNVNVTVKPLLSEANLHAHGWRRSIKPSSPAAWFHSYGRFLAPYLQVVQANRSFAFVLGTELKSLLRFHGYWSRLRRMAQRIYAGELAYDGYQSGPASLVLQENVWPSIRLAPNAGQRGLDAAWRTAVRNHSPSLRGVVISEIGMVAVPGGYAHPAHWFGQGNPSPAGRLMQARWFMAACRAALRVRVAGLYWWEINFGQLASPGDQFTFYNTPAQHAVRTCFTGAPR